MRWLLIAGMMALGVQAVQQAEASPEFLSYESRNSVREGQGGERKTVDGIDFWLRGDPPKRYQIIGSLTDERHKTGLIGLIRMSSLESDIAKAAKTAGGDAVILEGEQDEVTGVIGSSFGNTNGSFNATTTGANTSGSFNGFGSSVGSSHAMKDHQSRYWVVRYLPEAMPSSSPMPPASQQ